MIAMWLRHRLPRILTRFVSSYITIALHMIKIEPRLSIRQAPFQHRRTHRERERERERMAFQGRVEEMGQLSEEQQRRREEERQRHRQESPYTEFASKEEYLKAGYGGNEFQPTAPPTFQQPDYYSTAKQRSPTRPSE
ncbi:hypothetical protein KP509_33G046200 [Ceratopteris richardii]|uniref:Uncharacterized protein n=1 Tax=Ceratopteris richardii TaxID=49495 RepID=A0A8T2QNM1_CERRI|nr:hypothetical protein KP509_33G046200 [Ceratopteris richardii]